jgi:hypothetical protein
MDTGIRRYPVNRVEFCLLQAGYPHDHHLMIDSPIKMTIHSRRYRVR